MQRRAIALLVTLIFIIAITVSLGIGLKQVRKASSEVESENFMYQTRVILDDVTSILKSSKELDAVVSDSSGNALFIFLSQAAFIPFESSGVKISLELKSARAKINPVAFKKHSDSTPNELAIQLEKYLNRYGINALYVAAMQDLMGGVKQDLVYNSEIFNDKTALFRNYITSREHLGEVDDFYTKTYHDNSVKNVDFDTLFYFGSEEDSAVDLNYAGADVWELMLGCTKERAEAIALERGAWSRVEDIGLQEDEAALLGKFKTSYFEPFIYVVVSIMQNGNSAKISFEYDLITKEGTNFSYEL